MVPSSVRAVSVVIPTRDRADRAKRAVSAVLADPATDEVVVVDDGSTDHTREALRSLSEQDERVVVLRTEGVGAAGARQRGLEAASGGLVVMVDDDVVAGPDLITGHRRRHVDAGDPALVVAGYMPTRVPATRRPGQFATWFYAAEYEAHVAAWEDGSADVLDGLWLGNVSARRETWLAVGMDGGAFSAANHEDRDLGIRLAEAGSTATFDRTLRAEHAHRRRLDQFLRDAHRQGKGRAQLAMLHGTTEAMDSALGLDLPRPQRWILRATDRRSLQLVIVAACRVLVFAGGRLHLWAVEDAAARVLRRIELRRGARGAASGACRPRNIGEQGA